MRNLWVLFLALLLPLSPTLVAAAGEHGSGGAGQLGDLLYPLVNFLVFAYVVRRYGWPAVRTYLEERQSRVVEEQARGKTALEQAEARRAAAQARAQRLHLEREHLRQEIIGAAERLRDRLLRAAEESARRIARDAELVQAQERRAAMQQVRAHLAAETIREAENLLVDRVTERDHERFRSLLLEEVSRQ